MQRRQVKVVLLCAHPGNTARFVNLSRIHLLIFRLGKNGVLLDNRREVAIRFRSYSSSEMNSVATERTDSPPHDRRSALHRMLGPKAVALIGATETVGSVGRMLAENLQWLSSVKAAHCVRQFSTGVYLRKSGSALFFLSVQCWTSVGVTSSTTWPTMS